jgi:hypothetical protein
LLQPSARLSREIVPIVVTHDVLCILLANRSFVGVSYVSSRKTYAIYVGHSVAKWGGLCTSVPVRLICANCSLNVEVIVEHIPPISSTGLLNSRKS